MFNKLSQHWQTIQDYLFPFLEEELGAISENHKKVASYIDFLRVYKFIPAPYRGVGRPLKDRSSLAHAFLAKAVYNFPTTNDLIEHLKCDSTLRRICGFETRSSIPSKATFSRAFSEFSQLKLAQKVHDAFVETYHSDRLIGHVSRDSSAICSREKAVYSEKANKEESPKRKRGRPKKGEVVPPPIPTRLERQQEMNLEEMLEDLPKVCDKGAKINSKGYKIAWTGFKIHIDTIDGDIPISSVLTSASVHDSQVALPLSKITHGKVTALYELMDAAYDSSIIREETQSSGCIGLIDFNKRSKTDTRCFAPHEKERYKERSSAERVNGNLKDNCGGRFVRVKGHDKVFAHLGFGLLVIAVEQTLRLLS